MKAWRKARSATSTLTGGNQCKVADVAIEHREDAVQGDRRRGGPGGAGQRGQGLTGAGRGRVVNPMRTPPRQRRHPEPPTWWEQLLIAGTLGVFGAITAVLSIWMLTSLPGLDVGRWVYLLAAIALGGDVSWPVCARPTAPWMSWARSGTWCGNYPLASSRWSGFCRGPGEPRASSIPPVQGGCVHLAASARASGTQRASAGCRWAARDRRPVRARGSVCCRRLSGIRE